MPKDDERGKDPFSELMFPSRRERIQENVPEERTPKLSEHEWLFGKRIPRQEQIPSNHTQQQQPSAIEKAINNVNIPELINHFDTLMTSAQSLKPLYSQIKPVISSLLNSKK